MNTPLSRSSLGDRRSRSSGGFSFIEIILSVSLVIMIFFAVNEFFLRALAAGRMTTLRIQSTYVLEEGLEAIRAMRNANWSTHIAPLSTSTTYYLVWVVSSWAPTTTPQLIENTHMRSFVVRDVFRDSGTGDIVSSGGVFDPNTKLFIFTNEWTTRSGTTTETTETIIGNLFLN